MRSQIQTREGAIDCGTAKPFSVEATVRLMGNALSHEWPYQGGRVT